MRRRQVASAFLVNSSLADELQKISAVATFEQGLGQGFQLRGGDETHAVGNLFRTGDFEALAFFQGGDESRPRAWSRGFRYQARLCRGRR